MKIVVFGASGKTGIHLVKQSLDKGYDVTAYVRRENALQIEHSNLKIVTGDLSDTEKLKETIMGADVCISALGGASLTKHATEITNGIAQIVSLMEGLHVKRILYISSIGVGESRYYMPQPIRFFVASLLLRVPFADHYKNETVITSSQLEWTIIRPGGLTDGPVSKYLKSGSERIGIKGNPKVSRASVASFMLEQIAESTSMKKALWLYES